ncbi:hypothetical protein [Gemmatimonas sp. UBA7669]|uniref:hypothetical protein n=1 Tax=Gemmatimonas sp. UBA7669 TaxID=1946568 RepID=UPI0025C65B17|nr:hypothetical protein [Gemmatimonas sp. UBA7669]
MADDARTYLQQRFTQDAQQLRERVAQLRAGSSMPGPDAATSDAMANACDTVVAMLDALPTHDDVELLIRDLLALVPVLERHAQNAKQPPVRAVFIGAATRVREVTSAEQKALQAEDSAESDTP